MLEAQDLAFRYGPQLPWLWQAVRLGIAPGEVVGLYGPSGQGKTTLAKVLAGYLPPSQGRIQADGRPLPRQGYCPVQLIFQHPELAVNPRWRISQVLTEVYAPSPALLDALGISPAWLTRWPHELSGGELQRVAVARALGPGTRYLLADEMTAMLDAATQAQIWRAVLAHAGQQGIGVLVISHHAALLDRICTRVTTLT